MHTFNTAQISEKIHAHFLQKSKHYLQKFVYPSHRLSFKKYQQYICIHLRKKESPKEA